MFKCLFEHDLTYDCRSLAIIATVHAINVMIMINEAGGNLCRGAASAWCTCTAVQRHAHGIVSRSVSTFVRSLLKRVRSPSALGEGLQSQAPKVPKNGRCC